MITAAPLRTSTAQPRSTNKVAWAGLRPQGKCKRVVATSSLTGECEACKSLGRLQGKLAMGTNGDPFEREADRVADEVQATPAGLSAGKLPPHIQRSSGEPHPGAGTAPAGVDRVLASTGTPLEPRLRQDMEQRFGYDFSQVRVHIDRAAEQSAQELGARAYTVGQNVVFGKGQFAPGGHWGRWLIAHELTHVVQNRAAGSGETRQTVREFSDPSVAAPAHNYRRLARQIHEAIAGIGTDEEAVYRALQELRRDQIAILELERVYAAEYQSSLLDDIHDDFSGTELEFSLQLLNRGAPGAEQRIERAPETAADVETAAARIRRAVEGMGTDEEAIFAVLTPFARHTLDLQNAYQRRYGEDLRDRLVDELSGSELDYALELLETPYEHYVHEANQLLSHSPFGSFGDVSTFCLPEEKQTSSGARHMVYWYDKEFWDPEVKMQDGKGVCSVRLRPGKSPAEAIDAMFGHQERWKIACAEFVQIVHLYALRHTLGAERFDQRVGTGGFWLEVQRRASTGVETVVTFERQSATDPFVRSDTRQPDPRSVDEILAAAPNGSRVRWTNRVGAGRTGPNPWENENTIKLGPDRFGTPGTGASNVHSRKEVELLTARGTDPHADQRYVDANIFISQIEIFKEASQ